ncbi:uracil-DNA glycosylase [Aureimonas sp. ME7]|uniref:uracil-DNA glycosylase n=1 Tax=Aureimonas sp. ME7 TaxID=2744252 RepID=UPI0015F4346B|nr:uracil-DNA glycosylase [Aureimonas sp. ME7]
MRHSDHPSALDQWSALLDWYERAGVCSFVADEPRDRFAETEREATRRRPDGSAASARTQPQPTARPAAAAPPAMGLPMAEHGRSDIEDARSKAASAQTLAELQALLTAYTGCGLRQTAKNLVFGNGAEDADLMLVGEAPGRDEDLSGEPFVGRSGRLLDRMLGSIGVARDAVRVTNTVPWRPPGNRTPTPAETELCLPFTMRHIELVRPRVLVCLGSPASRVLLRSDEAITRLRGRWLSVTTPNGLEIPAIAMLHPAFLLRQPGQKRWAWRDLLTLRERLAELAR